MIQEWSLEEAKSERAAEIQRRRELLAVRKANALKAAERAAERRLALAASLRAASELEARALTGELGSGTGSAEQAAAQNGGLTADATASNPAIPLPDAGPPASPSAGDDRRKRCGISVTAILCGFFVCNLACVSSAHP